jgi:predicted dehydrogenase
MKAHRVGIIGYGWASTAHIAAINATSSAEVTAVWSSRKLDEGEISERHGCRIRCHQDLASMLADPEIDTVSICSYPYEHARQAIQAAGAGKHLIIEKPLALSLEDCHAIAGAVERAGVKTCVCFECRFSSQFQATKALLDRNLLGKVHYAEVDYYHGVGPWYGQYRWNTRKDAGGSSLLSAGCHALDGLLHLMGNEVESVTSFSTRSEHPAFARYEYDTTSVTVLVFKDGRLAKVASVLDTLAPYYFRVHLIGSEGTLLDNKFHATAIRGLDGKRWSSLAMKMLDSGDVADHPYQTQFQVFFDAIDRREEMPLTSLRDSLPTHEIIFAADRSAKEKRTIRL